MLFVLYTATMLSLVLQPHQVDPKRLLTDLVGDPWLRIEDAGYMDSDGRLWLVGRVKWRVERDGKTYWSTVVEQKVHVSLLFTPTSESWGKRS